MKIKKVDNQNRTILVLTMAIASALSWEVAKWFGSDHPYLAPLAIVLCLRSTIYQTMQHSLHRIIGTILAIILITYLVRHLPANGWTLGLLLLGGTMIVKWLRLNATILHQAALTIVLIFALEPKSKDYPVDRIVDTIIGALIAILLQMVFFPPDFTKKAASSLQKLSLQLSEILSEFANWIQTGWGKEKRSVLTHKINLFLQDLHLAEQDVNTAEKSLKYNPIRQKHRSVLLKLRRKMTEMKKGHQYVSALAETFKEWEKQGQLSSTDQNEIQECLKNLSEYFRNNDLNMNEGHETALLQSAKRPALQPEYTFYKDSFCFETENFLKSLQKER